MTTTPLLDRAVKIPVSGQSVSYCSEEYTPSPPNPDPGTMPSSSINFMVHSVPVKKIASLTVIPQSLAEDVPALKSLEDTVRNRLNETIDRELFNAIIDQVTRIRSGPLHKVWREIVTAMVTIEKESGLTPDILLTTPDIRRKLLRQGGFTYDPKPESYVGLEPGQILVGNSTAFAVALRGDPKIEVSNSHADFFRKNLWAYRAEQGAATLVYRPKSFVLVQTRAWPEKIARWRRNTALAVAWRLRAVKYWTKDELKKRPWRSYK